MQRKGPGMSPVRCILLYLCTGLILVSLLLLFLWPAARMSLGQLMNRLFDASEAVNTYLYDHIPVPESASPVLASCLLAMIVICVTGLVFILPGTGLALFSAIILAGVQIYFGLALPSPINIICFGLLAFSVILKRAGLRSAFAMLCCLLVSTLIIFLCFPGTHTGIESASEKVRDHFGYAIENSLSDGLGQPPSFMKTRHENRRDLAEGSDSALTGQEYRLITVEEQLINRPGWIDILRIVLLCLLIPVVLALPFLPFLWINSRNRKTAGKYACLESEDHRAAIRGMFALVIDYLDARQIGDPSGLHIHRLESSSELLSDSYRELYLRCASIWQEAVYSSHPMSNEQRSSVSELLDITENLLYDKADRRTQLRLKYIHCLHG